MICENRFIFVLLLYYSLVGIVVIIYAEHIYDRLQFTSEPVSQLSRADGSRVIFKCNASPPEANIKWLRNGSIIKDDEYDWIKVHGNKLILKLQKSLQNSYNKNKNASNDPISFQSASSPNEVYQCLAELNNQVIVSQPAKLIMAELHSFDHHENITVTVIAGNTAVIPCDLPQGVPFVISEFEFGNMTIAQSYGNIRCYYLL